MAAHHQFDDFGCSRKPYSRYSSPALSNNNKPTMDSDLGDCDVLITDCVLDFSKYLTSTDFPASPEEFFDDLFDGDATEKGLPANVKVKEEFCNSTSSSRCSTPESLLPEHDFENDFPSPAFSESSEDGLMYQLHSLKDGNSQGFDAKVTKALTHIQHQQQQASGSGDGKVASSSKPKQKATNNKRKMTSDKKSCEYRMKRERNNVAVRKSRTKAKIKHIETQMKVSELTEENDQLRNKISLLQRELSSLRNFVAANTPSVMSPQPPKAPSYAYPGSLRADAPSMYSLIMDKSKQNNPMGRVC